MGQGLRVWDASGTLVFDTPDRMARIVGSIAVNEGTGFQTLAISLPAGVQPFWFATGVSTNGVNQLPDVTMSLTSIKYGYSGSCVIFYGYY